MQQPTLQNVRIRSTRDALQIFYAVARNILPITSRRLDAEERRAIVPGNVYVWEERCANSEVTGLGMERWTDGMGWGPSRVRDEFLFYHQRESEVSEDPNNPSAKWATIMKRREPRAGGSSYSRTDAERLIKQTYSVHVSLPEDRARGVTHKWHLTAYFSQTTLDALGTIDVLPGVGDVPVPRGLFRSARASKARRNDSNTIEDVPVSSDPWGLGTPPSANYGTSQFAIDRTAGMPNQHQWVGSTHSAPSPRPAPSPCVLEDHTEDTHRSPEPHPTAYASCNAYASPSHPPRLPTLVASGLDFYRDPSPFTNSSSSSSDISSSPRFCSAPLEPQLPPYRSGSGAGKVSKGLDLVPLALLENMRPPSRDPTDEDVLRRLSSAHITFMARHQWA